MEDCRGHADLTCVTTEWHRLAVPPFMMVRGRGLVWKGCAVPELPAVTLAQSAPSAPDCASLPIPFVLLAFSAKKSSNSTSHPPEK